MSVGVLFICDLECVPSITLLQAAHNTQFQKGNRHRDFFNTQKYDFFVRAQF